jgi:hypothetical protein
VVVAAAAMIEVAAVVGPVVWYTMVQIHPHKERLMDPLHLELIQLPLEVVVVQIVKVVIPQHLD